MEIMSRKSGLSEPDISCQKHNLKLVRADYIYLNFGEKSKGQTSKRSSTHILKIESLDIRFKLP